MALTAMNSQEGQIDRQYYNTTPVLNMELVLYFCPDFQHTVHLNVSGEQVGITGMFKPDNHPIDQTFTTFSSNKPIEQKISTYSCPEFRCRATSMLYHHSRMFLVERTLLWSTDSAADGEL